MQVRIDDRSNNGFIDCTVRYSNGDIVHYQGTESGGCFQVRRDYTEMGGYTVTDTIRGQNWGSWIQYNP